MDLLRRGWKMVVAESTSDTQMVTPLPSRFLVAFSAPTIELRYWLFVQLLSICWRVGKNGKYRHLHRLSIKPSSPQLSWPRPDDPRPALLPCQADSSVYSILPAGACSCGTDRKRKSRQTCKNRQSSSADRILSPTERPRHFSTLGTMETGRNTTVDIRHTLTQFGDWSGPSRPLSSACAQGIVVWVPIWRGLAFQTLPSVSAHKLTKPQITSFSPAQNMLRDVS